MSHNLPISLEQRGSPLFAQFDFAIAVQPIHTRAIAAHGQGFMSARAVDEERPEAARRSGGGGPCPGDGQREQCPGAACAARPQSHAGTTTGGGSNGGGDGGAFSTSRLPWPQRSTCAYQVIMANTAPKLMRQRRPGLQCSTCACQVVDAWLLQVVPTQHAILLLSWYRRATARRTFGC